MIFSLQAQKHDHDRQIQQSVPYGYIWQESGPQLDAYADKEGKKQEHAESPDEIPVIEKQRQGYVLQCQRQRCDDICTPVAFRILSDMLITVVEIGGQFSERVGEWPQEAYCHHPNRYFLEQET